MTVCPTGDSEGGDDASTGTGTAIGTGTTTRSVKEARWCWVLLASDGIAVVSGTLDDGSGADDASSSASGDSAALAAGGASGDSEDASATGKSLWARARLRLATKQAKESSACRRLAAGACCCISS